ncbi:hypothetical protein ACFL5O_03545 [Myxococcota bacterium]
MNLRIRAWLAMVGWVAALGPVGCRERPEAAQAQPVNPVLLAFLSRARAGHHRADLLEDELQLPAALDELGEILNGPQPPGASTMNEVREVLADTRARSADLKSRVGRFEEALHDIEQGLKWVPDVTYYRGHLLEVRGLIEERRALALEKRIQRQLRQMDARMVPGAEPARRREQLLGSIGRGHAATPNSSDASNRISAPERAGVRTALSELRRSLLSEPERQALGELEAQRRASLDRALRAFQQSMQLQAEVIRSLTPAHPEARPAPSSSERSGPPPWHRPTQ